MTGEVVNLNKHRKRRARQEREARAEANRVKHGRTAEERRRAEDEVARRRRDLDGHRLEGDGPGDDA